MRWPRSGHAEGRIGLSGVVAGPDEGQAGGGILGRIEGVDQALLTEVQPVVVGQRDHVHARRTQGGQR